MAMASCNGQDFLAKTMKNLVLIGGGHSHAILLQRVSANALQLFGMQPPAAKLTLITDTLYAPYSGMLPGYVRGYYGFTECHIDLAHLARSAQARLILDRAIGLDLPKKQVWCADRDPINFDLLAIDIGSTPAQIAIPGAAEYAIPAKPVPEFLAIWQGVLGVIADWDAESPLSIGIVGGGAGGVELALNIQGRIAELLGDRGLPGGLLTVHLFHRQQELMTGYLQRIGGRFRRLLYERGIQLHLGRSVIGVDCPSDSSLLEEFRSNSAGAEDRKSLGLEKVIHCDSGLIVKCNYVFWVTNAAAPSWLKKSGLTTDDQGFIVVNDTLQSVSHPDVFATGDIATMIGQPRPKAGVFAVRQGQPLLENLQRVLVGQDPQPFYSQKRHLALIGTGDQQAVAAWGGSVMGPWNLLWRWKDRIDRRFMKQFEVESMRQCLIVFTRYPEVGKVKTRLIPALGQEGAMVLHRQMVERTIKRARAWREQSGLSPAIDSAIEVWFTGGDEVQMAAWLGEDLGYVRQPEGDLGDRMATAFREAFEQGYGSVVIIGTDCPGIDMEVLAEGFGLLEQQELVLGPAQDGGYYLIGLQRLVPELFRSISWSTAEVLKQTEALANSLDLTRAYLPELADVDLPKDLAVWEAIN
jgi:rSAM/selenodomain-associated transferase 1